MLCGSLVATLRVCARACLSILFFCFFILVDLFYSSFFIFSCFFLLFELIVGAFCSLSVGVCLLASISFSFLFLPLYPAI